MLPKAKAIQIARLFRYFDAICRNDLKRKDIVTERDYVSNLATHIRYPHGALSSDKLRHIHRQKNLHRLIFRKDISYKSTTLSSTLEQTFGCDSIIIFSVQQPGGAYHSRIGMYEAKLPRLTGKKPVLKWDDVRNRPVDKKKGASKIWKSRFSSELLLQQPLSGIGIAVWEQFFCDQFVEESKHQFKKYGSTCVFHEEALNHFSKDATLNANSLRSGIRSWSGDDLEHLMKHHGMSFGYLIYLLLTSGKYTDYEDVGGFITLRPRISPALDIRTAIADPIGIPVLFNQNENVAYDDNETVVKFMRKYGFHNYTHVSVGLGYFRKDAYLPYADDPTEEEQWTRFIR